MKSSKLLASAPFFLLLVACTTPTPVERAAIAAPTRWQTGVQPPRERLADWWCRFADAQLVTLVKRAEANSPDLGAALARVEQARAQAKIVGTGRWPAVQLGANGNHERLLQGPGYSGIDTERDSRRLDTFSLGALASYEVDFWGGVAARARSGTANWQASVFELDTLALTLTAAVAASYLDLSAAQARLRIAQDNLANAEQVSTLVAKRQAAGAANPLEVAQQRGLVARQRQQLARLLQDEADARLILATLVGDPVERLKLTPMAFNQLSDPEIGVGPPSELLIRRPDVARAEARLAAAQADIQVARSLMLPRLTLKANLAVGANGFSDLFTNRYYDLGGALLAPIFDAGALRAGYQVSQARRQELLEDYRKVVLAAYTDVDRALNDRAGLDHQQAYQTEAMAQARATYTLAQTRYLAGAENLLTLLDAQRALYQLQDEAIVLRRAQLQARVALYKALGGGWEQ